MIVALAGLCVLAAALELGWIRTPRGQRMPKRPRRPLRRVARPTRTVWVGDEWVCVAADYIAPREAFDPATRALLDALVFADRARW